MSDDALRSVCDAGVNPDWPSFPPLCASPLDAALVSNELEHELRSLVTQHRRVRSCLLVTRPVSGQCSAIVCVCPFAL